MNYLHSTFAYFQGRAPLCTGDSTAFFSGICGVFLFPVGNFIAYQSDSMHKHVQRSKQKSYKDGSMRRQIKKTKSLLVLYIENSYEEERWTETDCYQDYKARNIAKPRVLIISLMIQHLHRLFVHR